MQVDAVRSTSTAWMDTARVVAIVLVVLDHVVIGLAPLTEQDTTDLRWWVTETLLAASRLAVPVFLMVSGALLLDPSRTETVRSFAGRRLSRVAVPLLFWAVAYLTFRRDVLGEDLSGGAALREFLRGDPYYHLYYLYIALGLYALTPFLRRLIAVVDQRTIAILCGLAFGLGIVDQFLRTVLQVGSSNGITLFVDYVGFYLAGWLLRDAARHGRAVSVAAPALLAALAFIVLSTAVLIEAGQGQHWFYPATYLNPAVIAASVALFVLLQRAGPVGSRSSVARRLSDVVLGTYLVHPMILDLIRQEYSAPTDLLGMLGWIAGLTLVGVVAPMTITFAGRLVPVVRRVL